MRRSSMGLVLFDECDCVYEGTVIGVTLAIPGIMVSTLDVASPLDSMSAATDE